MDKMLQYCGAPVTGRFKNSLTTGEPTPAADQTAIEAGLFAFATANGAASYAHWFFPVRTGSGVMGSTAGMKHDTFIDLDWGSDNIVPPMVVKMPKGRLFNGETDGSSFPNGGMRVTHQAAAFTSWDRGSPPFVHDKTLYIPCCFVTHYGKALDDKTPLLRAQDAVNTQGLRLLKNIGGYDDVSQVVSYLGWEQEFFVISKESYLKRPDLRACGRTVMGAPPTRGQQMDLNYFAGMPKTVKDFMDELHEVSLKLGCPMSVYHNEVAPAQHEYSPIFRLTNISSDSNQIIMQISVELAAKHGLVILFHEKPFAGINGSGKHNNWSIGTNKGTNFFSPGKDEKQATLFTTALACLTYACNEHNVILRNSVAHAGNDWRLGAQEAPPAIISLYPGTTFEAHMEAVIAGGELGLLKLGGGLVETGSKSTNPVTTGLEDRNRTAPFPFCGNRFEFRAPGSSQNCGFPMAMVNTAFADGMCVLNDALESGTPLRDAVANMFKEHKRVVFCGNGYSAEWPIEAAKRGLPNLKDSVEAAKEFATPKNIAVFEKMGVFTAEEVHARAECMFENYATILQVEATTLIEMVRTGVEPAVAQDLAIYPAGSVTATKREKVYASISTLTDALETLMSNVPEDLVASCDYYAGKIKPAMLQIRESCDIAESLVKKDLWPYPSYTEMCYSHHMEKGATQM